MEKKNIRDCDEFDAELLIKIYPWLEERCKRKDMNIQKIACAYSNTSYGANEIYEQILDEIELKNQMINLKLVIDEILTMLKPKNLKWALVMMDYRGLSKGELDTLFDEKERTGFRRIETLFMTMAYLINKNDEHKSKVVNFIHSNYWAETLLEDITERRLSFRRDTKEEQE